MKELLEKLPWRAVILLCLTLGLAPYWPPHLFEKLSMLVQGKLVRAVDWFDLFLHSSPWFILMLKAFM
jgi:hypothetical protein